MSITIGSFSSNTLTAQPFGYEGDTRQGLTIRAVRFSGLLTPEQWSALTSEYDSWAASRINDQDTLLSQSTGTTVTVSCSANGISWSSVDAWFDAPPSGEQVGAYISASCTLINADDALAVLLREQELANERQRGEAALVDCTVIAANLQRQKDETDCELTALAGGLAADFAEQTIARAKLDAQAKATAEAAATADLSAIKAAEASSELLDKQAQLAGRTASASNIAAADLDLELLQNQAQATAYAAGTSDLAAIETAKASVELLQKQAQLAGRAASANDLAAAELDLELQQAQARATAYAAGTADLSGIKGAELDVELLQYAAKVSALTSGSRLDNLKTARALDAVYEKYINEDLPNLGTVSVGSATVTLTKPMETRQDGPQVALTAGGTSYITGALAAHAVRQVEGYVSSGSYSDMLSWYDSTVASVPSAGSWFPVSPPSATAEPFLIAGVKSTRYNVSITMVQIR